MQPKKNPNADLRGYRFLFFEIGLTVALVLVAGVFRYGRTDPDDARKLVTLPVRIIQAGPEE